MVAVVLVGMIGDAIRKFREWRERQQQYNELNKMSDHELRDIGLNRCDVLNFK